MTTNRLFRLPRSLLLNACLHLLPIAPSSEIRLICTNTSSPTGSNRPLPFSTRFPVSAGIVKNRTCFSLNFLFEFFLRILSSNFSNFSNLCEMFQTPLGTPSSLDTCWCKRPSHCPCMTSGLSGMAGTRYSGSSISDISGLNSMFSTRDLLFTAPIPSRPFLSLLLLYFRSSSQRSFMGRMRSVQKVWNQFLKELKTTPKQHKGITKC